MNELPTSGLTDRQLKLSYWYISHKLLLRRWLVVFLIIFSSLAWSYVIWQGVDYALNYQEQKQLENYLLFTSDPSLAAIENSAPKNISISDVLIFSTDTGYDYYASILNDNKDWLAEFDYRFVTDKDEQYKQGFVLPGSEQSLMEFSKASDQTDLQIANIKWVRIDDFEALKNKMDYFIIENEKFTIGQGSDPSELSYEITNKSPYSYWNVDMQVIVENGGTMAGINHSVISQFKSDEKKVINLFWNHKLPSGSAYRILPVVNFLNSSNIMAVSQ